MKTYRSSAYILFIKILPNHHILHNSLLKCQAYYNAQHNFSESKRFVDRYRLGGGANVRFGKISIEGKMKGASR